MIRVSLTCAVNDLLRIPYRSRRMACLGFSHSILYAPPPVAGRCRQFTKRDLSYANPELAPPIPRLLP